MEDRFVYTMATKTSGACVKLRTCSSSLCCESVVVTLTLVSVLAITGEILIDFGILTALSSPTEQQQSSVSASVSDNNTSDGDTSSVDSKRPSDDDLDTVQTVFHYISLTIAALFFFEIMIKLIVYRRKFLLHVLQVLDMLLVVAAVIVELVFEIRGRIPELEACTFIIIFRLWRLPHMCNIKAEALRRDMEQDLEVWKASKSKLEDRWQVLQSKYDKQKKRIEWLEQEVMELKREKKTCQNQTSSQSSDTSATIYNVPIHTLEDFSTSRSVSKDPVTELCASIGTHFNEDEENGIIGKTEEIAEDKRNKDSMKDECEQDDFSRNSFQLDSGSSVLCYHNEGFSLERDQRQEGNLHDEDSLRTYTSAEGIPMTEL